MTVECKGCSWLGYSYELAALVVEAEATDNNDVGVYSFTVIVSDNFPYGINYSAYKG